MADVPWVEPPAARTRHSMRALFDRIAERCDLPPLPAVAARALELVRAPDTKADDLAHLVSTDTAIAARVLRISRSVVYARRKMPRTLHKAIATVGFEALRQILVVASARNAYRVRLHPCGRRRLSRRAGDVDYDIVAAIMFHHRDDPAEFSELAGRIAKADRIADHLGLGSIVADPAAAAPENGDTAWVSKNVVAILAAERALFD